MRGLDMIGAIPGKEFIKWLEDAGIIADGARVARVVIDARAMRPIMVYVEMLGSDKMISVAPPPELRGATIEVFDKPKEEPHG